MKLSSKSNFVKICNQFSNMVRPTNTVFGAGGNWADIIELAALGLPQPHLIHLPHLPSVLTEALAYSLSPDGDG